MKSITGQVYLSALADGTTINATLLSDKPLEQWYDPAQKTAVTPDWEKNAALRPTIYAVVRDTTTGVPIASGDIKNVKFYYNETEITFGSSGNLNTNAEFAGLFEKASHNVGGSTVVPALKVCKNFPQFGSYNNDIIKMEGSVEYDGQHVWFKNIEIPVVIQEKAGDLYAIQVKDLYQFQIPKGKEETTSTAHLLRAGTELDASAMTGISFEWEIMGTEGYTPLPSAKISGKYKETAKIHRDDIDSTLVLRVSAKKGQDVLARGLYTYTDANDPLVVETSITLKGGGDIGEHIRKGETAVVASRVIHRDSGSAYAKPVTWERRIYKNDGTPLSEATSSSTSEVTYDTIIRGGKRIRILTRAKLQ